MPVGLYTRKGKNGRTMYFRDGKLISKKSYTASRGRSQKRRPSTTRRKRTTGNPRRKNNMARYRKPAIPHPSISGMASGLAIATYLNKGSTGKGSGQTVGVIKHIMDSKYSSALDQVANNAMNLATSEGGRKVLTGAIALAAAGGVVRKWFPTLKLGGNRLFFRV